MGDDEKVDLVVKRGRGRPRQEITAETIEREREVKSEASRKYYMAKVAQAAKKAEYTAEERARRSEAMKARWSAIKEKVNRVGVVPEGPLAQRRVKLGLGKRGNREARSKRSSAELLRGIQGRVLHEMMQRTRRDEIGKMELGEMAGILRACQQALLSLKQEEMVRQSGGAAFSVVVPGVPFEKTGEKPQADQSPPMVLEGDERVQ